MLQPQKKEVPSTKVSSFSRQPKLKVQLELGSCSTQFWGGMQASAPGNMKAKVGQVRVCSHWQPESPRQPWKKRATTALQILEFRKKADVVESSTALLAMPVSYSHPPTEKPMIQRQNSWWEWLGRLIDSSLIDAGSSPQQKQDGEAALRERMQVEVGRTPSAAAFSRKFLCWEERPSPATPFSGWRWGTACCTKQIWLRMPWREPMDTRSEPSTATTVPSSDCIGRSLPAPPLDCCPLGPKNCCPLRTRPGYWARLRSTGSCCQCPTGIFGAARASPEPPARSQPLPHSCPAAFGSMRSPWAECSSHQPRPGAVCASGGVGPSQQQRQRPAAGQGRVRRPVGRASYMGDYKVIRSE